MDPTGYVSQLSTGWCKKKATVDEQNPAQVDMVNIPWSTRN